MRIEVQNNVINKEVLERNKKYLMPNWKNNLARIYIPVFDSCTYKNPSKILIYSALFEGLFA